MNAEELGFVNQQLAGMLRHGIPLESALGQLCQSMRRGDLRTELEQLHQSLAAGTPFEEAVTARKEARLAQFAGATAMMLRSGCTLDESLAFLVQLEGASPAQREVVGWRHRLAHGAGTFDRIAEGGKLFPPLFVALVANARDDLASGFSQAANIYETRAAQRSEIMLQAALPVAILALGLLIGSQLWGLLSLLTGIIGGLGGW